MLIDNLLRSARWIGARATWESVRFAWSRDRIEAGTTSAEQQPARTPGPLLSAEARPDGADFSFERAQLSLTYLARWALRVEWSPGDPPPPYSLARASGEATDVDLQPDGEGWRLSTPELSARLDQAGGLHLSTGEENPLQQLAPPLRHGEAWRQQADLPPEARVFGLGERAAPLNLRPGSYRLWNTDPGGAYESGEDPLYLSIPLLVTLHAAGSHLLYFENPHDGVVRLDHDVELEFRSGQHRYVFISGEPPLALQRLTRLVGRPAMPPRWALGYHQSRWGYMDEEHAQRIIEGFERHNLPLSALHLDIDYMDGYRVFTVDSDRFPALPALAEECDRRLGARLVAIIDPGVKVDPQYELYRQGLERDAFCTLPDGQPLRGAVWPGAVHYPDFTDPNTRRWWGERYADLLDDGIAGIWHDMNEPTSFAAWGDTTLPLPTRHELEGQAGDHRAGHNVYGHLMNRAGHEALLRHRPDQRPFLVSRSGYAGSARYAWNWTGDTASTWQALRQTVPTVLGLGLSGVPFTGPDIGGFSGAPDAELYLRWFQLGALLPFFRTHCSKSSPPREPWTFGPEALEICRHYLHLRQRLMPYLYTLAAQSHRTGWPLARPLFWHNPRRQELWDVDDAFLLGDRLLVAPALTAGTTERGLTLPPGRWYDFWSGEQYHGPGEITVPAPLERTPILVRAGSALPLADGDSLTLQLYPPDAPVPDQPLYSDGGDGFGAARWDYFSLSPRKNGFALGWRSEGAYPWSYQGLTLAFRGAAAGGLRLDGRKVSLEGQQVEVERFQQAEILIPPRT